MINKKTRNEWRVAIDKVKLASPGDITEHHHTIIELLDSCDEADVDRERVDWLEGCAEIDREGFDGARRFIFLTFVGEHGAPVDAVISGRGIRTIREDIDLARKVLPTRYLRKEDKDE